MNPNVVCAVDPFRRRRRHALEREPHGRGFDRRTTSPSRARDRGLQIRRRDAVAGRSEMKYPIGCCFQVASMTLPFTIAPSLR